MRKRYSWVVPLKRTNNMVCFLEQYLFDFSPLVVHLTLFPLFFIMTKVSHSNTHVESENRNTKRRMETKIISYFCFWIKWCWRVNSMKKTSSMSKDSSNLSKPRFGCYFPCNLVNFKSVILFCFFWNIWVMYGSWKVKEVLCLIWNI